MSDPPPKLRAPRSDYEFTTMLELYKEHCAHGRHLESQRSTVASMFLTASGILLSVAGALKLSLASLPLAICVVGLAYYAKQFVRVTPSNGTRRPAGVVTIANRCKR